VDPSERAARIVRTATETLQPRFAVELWTGERIGPPTGPVLKINDKDAIGKIVRRPSFETLLKLWISKALDVEDGTLFDIIAQRPEMRTSSAWRALPKLQLLRDIPALLLGGGGNEADARLVSSDPFASGSDRAAITHHYDISNDFYRLFLDRNMVYSCGYFTDFANGIDQAQTDKLDHICKKLRLQPGERLLDIGCGWGAMLIHAAKNYGVTGHGVSLSEAQSALARERVRAEGLEDRITIEVKSYTELDRSFDKISSIGMFEHTGIANHDAYFEAIHRLLKPGGIYLHHAITRRNKPGRNAWRRKNPANRALAKYIFPGGEVDYIGRTIGMLEAHRFEVHDVENLREHYARTCRLWAERLHARFDEAIKEVGEPKARLWLFYLTGCSVAFDRGSLLIYQTVATRRARGPGGLPPTRADLYRDR
jgi:cyclopropane-fatty-acyl-phospholipid synthase